MANNAKAVENSVDVAELTIKKKNKKRLKNESEDVRKLSVSQLSDKLEQSKISLLTKESPTLVRRLAVSETDKVERELVKLSVKHLMQEKCLNNCFW